MNVLVICNDTRSQHLLYRTLLCLQVAGHRSFVVASRNRKRTAARFSRHKRKWIDHSAETLDSATINQHCKRYNIDVVMPTDITSTLLLSRLQHEITAARIFPLMPPDVLSFLHNKGAFMQWLEENQLPCPETRLITADSNLEDIDWEYPLIAKPLDEEGGEGVQKIDSPQELKAYRNTRESKGQKSFLVQKFIPGKDIVFGVLAEKGELRAWTIQIYEKDYVDFIDHPGLIESARQILRKLNYHGVAEFDVRLDDEGNVKFIECNPRIWASVVISMCIGVNFIDLGLLMAEGSKLQAMESQVGSYVDPTFVLKKILRKPSHYATLSQASRNALSLRLSDPLPLLHYAWTTVFPNGEAVQ